MLWLSIAHKVKSLLLQDAMEGLGLGDVVATAGSGAEATLTLGGTYVLTRWLWFGLDHRDSEYWGW